MAETKQQQKHTTMCMHAVIMFLFVGAAAGAADDEVVLKHSMRTTPHRNNPVNALNFIAYMLYCDVSPMLMPLLLLFIVIERDIVT